MMKQYVPIAVITVLILPLLASYWISWWRFFAVRNALRERPILLHGQDPEAVFHYWLGRFVHALQFNRVFAVNLGFATTVTAFIFAFTSDLADPATMKHVGWSFGSTLLALFIQLIESATESRLETEADQLRYERTGADLTPPSGAVPQDGMSPETGDDTQFTGGNPIE
jgi:hypothetical protein